MKDFLLYTSLVILISALTQTAAQNGFPPRLAVPGAIPILQRPSLQQFRNERLLAPNNNGIGGGPNAGFVRIRRPSQLQARQNQFQTFGPNALADEAKPVTEETESGENPTFFIAQQQPTIQPHRQLPALLYSTDENGEIFGDGNRQNDGPTTHYNPPQERIVPTTLRPSNAQRFAITQNRPVADVTPKPLRARPDYREPRPNFENNRPEPVQQIQPIRRPQAEQVPRPKAHFHDNHDNREKKPVAQILRKYREENEDGTITWGFENDDGSFKEEIIGNDCVTKGRYGYIDPDGVKREYTYETGNVCDPNKRDQEDEEDIEDGENGPREGGYVDYQENQMVLPNGQRINLSAIGKNKSRRPQQYN